MFLARLISLFGSERRARGRRIRRGGFRPGLETLERRQLLSGCTPVVVTDQAEYVRGETAEISGSCFQAGEQVTLQVVHTDGTTGGGARTVDCGGGHGRRVPRVVVCRPRRFGERAVHADGPREPGQLCHGCVQRSLLRVFQILPSARRSEPTP